MKFTVEKARGTKDVDFILDVVALRKEPLQLAKVLESLGYKPVPESRNFQFVKDIPGSKETMRIEFMARKSSNGAPTFVSKFRTECMREPALAARSHLPNPTSMRSPAGCPTALPMPQTSESPDLMRSSC